MSFIKTSSVGGGGIGKSHFGYMCSIPTVRGILEQGAFQDYSLWDPIAKIRVSDVATAAPVVTDVNLQRRCVITEKGNPCTTVDAFLKELTEVTLDQAKTMISTFELWFRCSSVIQPSDMYDLRLLNRPGLRAATMKVAWSSTPYLVLFTRSTIDGVDALIIQTVFGPDDVIDGQYAVSGRPYVDAEIQYERLTGFEYRRILDTVDADSLGNVARREVVKSVSSAIGVHVIGTAFVLDAAFAQGLELDASRVSYQQYVMRGPGAYSVDKEHVAWLINVSEQLLQSKLNDGAVAALTGLFDILRLKWPSGGKSREKSNDDVTLNAVLNVNSEKAKMALEKYISELVILQRGLHSCPAFLSRSPAFSYDPFGTIKDPQTMRRLLSSGSIRSRTGNLQQLATQPFGCIIHDSLTVQMFDGSYGSAATAGGASTGPINEVLKGTSRPSIRLYAKIMNGATKADWSDVVDIDAISSGHVINTYEKINGETKMSPETWVTYRLHGDRQTAHCLAQYVRFEDSLSHQVVTACLVPGVMSPEWLYAAVGLAPKADKRIPVLVKSKDGQKLLWSGLFSYEGLERLFKPRTQLKPSTDSLSFMQRAYLDEGPEFESTALYQQMYLCAYPILNSKILGGLA